MPNEQFGERELLSESGFHQFVPVVFADSPMEAERYRLLLQQRDIPVVVQETPPTSDRFSPSIWDVPVLVPDELLNDASEIIAFGAAPDDDDDYDDDDDDYLEQDDQQDDLDEDEDDDYGLDEDFDDDEDVDDYENEEDLFDQSESDYE